MNEDFYNGFKRTVSSERLEKYKDKHKPLDHITTVSNYAWNVAIAESFYPALHFFEIALRNAIHQGATQAFKREDWYNVPNLLEQKQQGELDRVKNQLIFDHKVVNAPNIIASLTFGFWTSLFTAPYDQKFFIKVSSLAFPNMANAKRVRKTFSGPLQDIRKFRNRVMHYEPIWTLRDLSRKHDTIYKIISYINKEKIIILRSVDRFPSLYRNGSAIFARTLQAKWQLAYDK